MCTLGLSVVPDWQSVFDVTFDLLRPGGRYAIMDWHQPQETLKVRLVDAIARSDIQRPTWELLAASCDDFSIRWYFWGRIFVASGAKTGLIRQLTP